MVIMVLPAKDVEFGKRSALEQAAFSYLFE
jgi:hypothetical protein